MSIVVFFVGVAVGAAFSPFWITLWEAVKNKLKKGNE